ncbi:MAG: nucleotide exchange factor GrpE [Bryobacteraceae bacterium]|nr:nucleotide exchange factor GrpE [Bryobacteraceae bacterium]
MEDSKIDLEATPSQGEAQEGAPSEMPVDTSALAAERDQLIVEKDRLVAENNELQDRLLRLRAEFDNFRKRAERDRAELVEYAAMDVLRPVLPILDDFERALKVETSDKEYAKGMELIYNRTLEIVKKLGLEPIESTGKTFDPYIHHAVEMVETDEADDNTILEEYQRGYNFKGRLLRPAMVKVAVKPRNSQ